MEDDKNSTEMIQHAESADKLNDNLRVAMLPVTIIIGAEAVIGLLGNILILFVYGKFYFNSNFRYFVLCLAVYDLSSCLTTLPGEMYTQMNWYTFRYDWVCKLKSYFNVFTAWGAAFTLLLLSFDRCRKTSRPLARQIHPPLALKLCMLGLCLSAVVSIPVTIFWGKQTYTIKVDNTSLNVSICEKSGTYADDIHPFLYITCVYVFPVGVMMLAICVCNIFLTRTLLCKNLLRLASLERRKSSYGSSYYIRNKPISPLEQSDLSDSVSDSSGAQKGLANISYEVNSNNETNHGCIEQPNQRNRSLSLFSITIQEHFKAGRFYSTKDKDKIQRMTHFAELQSYRKTSRENSASPCSTSKVNVINALVVGKERGAKTLANIKRKAMITLILTSVFVITTSLYVVLITIVSQKSNILRTLPNSEKVIFLFCLRLYFINSVINPVLYGLADPRFRQGLSRLFHLR